MKNLLLILLMLVTIAVNAQTHKGHHKKAKQQYEILDNDTTDIVMAGTTIIDSGTAITNHYIQLPKTGFLNEWRTIRIFATIQNLYFVGGTVYTYQTPITVLHNVHRAVIRVQYDVPSNKWYFRKDKNGHWL